MDIHQFSQWILNQDCSLLWQTHWIDNKWHSIRKSTQVKNSINPNTGKTLVEVQCDRESINLAIESAFNTRISFASQDLGTRIEYLKRLRMALADYQNIVEWVLRLESGKPLWEAKSDFESAIHYLDFCIENGDEVLDSLKSPVRFHPFIVKSTTQTASLKFLPLGVAAAYLPFSTPLTSFVFYLCATAVAGCPLILCTSSHAILFGILIGLLTERSQAELSGINIIFSSFNGFKQLLADKRIAAILYTGSREHCDVIRVESRHHVGRQLVLQSGGKNAVIVHPSADFQLAIQSIAEGALTTAGQRCTSTSRIFLHRDIMKEFSSALVESFKKVTIGRSDVNLPDNSSPIMGPLYSQKALDKYLRFQTMAHRESAKTLLWGKALEGSQGYFVTPSIHFLTKFDNSSAYQGSVLFSPDLAIYEYETLESAINQINTTDSSFAVSFMGDPKILEQNRNLFLASNLIVNGPTIETSATLPLAGRLQSGHHRYHGPGAAFYLCYPQILYHSANTQKWF